jgi:hypothetical protein
MLSSHSLTLLFNQPTVIDHFHLNREVVSISMNHLDRYLAAYPSAVNRQLFQLLAMTCLYLSIKLNEIEGVRISGSKSTMDAILQLSRGWFTIEQMEKMEYDILQRLQWRVHPPTVQLFVMHLSSFLSCGDSQQECHDMAIFLAELSVIDYYFVSYKPSEVALAALLNALHELAPSRLDLVHLFSFPVDQQWLPFSPNVLACRERLALIYAEGSNRDGDDSPIATLPATNCDSFSQHRTTSPVSVMAAPTPAAYAQHTHNTNYYHYHPPSNMWANR